MHHREFLHHQWLRSKERRSLTLDGLFICFSFEKEYALRVNRLSNDRSSSSVVIRKRFRQFFELNETLRDFGYQIDFPKKKIFGNTNPTFLGQRQKELQVTKKRFSTKLLLFTFSFPRFFSTFFFNMSNFVNRFSSRNLSLKKIQFLIIKVRNDRTEGKKTKLIETLCSFSFSFTTCLNVCPINQQQL